MTVPAFSVLPRHERLDADGRVRGKEPTDRNRHAAGM